MSTLRFVQITCDPVIDEHCRRVYPDQPVEGDVTPLREQAAAAGWETRRGTKHGRDACPHCRIVEIATASDAARRASEVDHG